MQSADLKNKKPYSPRLRYFLLLLLILGSFGLGWTARSYSAQQSQATQSSARVLRLSGYTYINPLLAYDIDPGKNVVRFNKLKLALEQIIQNEQRTGNLDSASVYLRSFNTGEVLAVNPGEKYAPASLNKIPLMITLFKMAESDTGIFKRTVTLPGDLNANLNLEISPTDILKPGQTYTIQEALQKLIVNSDNNAYEALIRQADLAIYQQSFKDLKLPLLTNSSGPVDYLTAKDFSYFLRVLYNATYLSRESSEQALKLLAELDFKDGLVAGVPELPVAHKFGIATYGASASQRTRELHDCGIIYHPERPYLLCVMTKGKGKLADSTRVIKDISARVYLSVESDYKK